MDDAANGLRGLRAAASQELLDLLTERYGFGQIGEIRDLGGSSNLNLLIASGGRPYVARVYRPYVSAARLDAMQRVRHELVKGGVPCVEPVPTRDGEYWAQIDGRLVEVEAFVEHDDNMNIWELIELGLPWLGRVHSLLRGVKIHPEGRAPLFANHIESFETLAWTQRAANRVCRWNPSPAELQLIERVEELARQLVELEREFVTSVPRQLVHGDFWDNNVLFRNGKLVLIADLDFMGERARIDDLALTLYFAGLAFSEKLVSNHCTDGLVQLVDAYESGLDDPLSGVERAALPYAMARQPLWWAGRWLALLDDEEEARNGFACMTRDVEWALQVLCEAGRWQNALTNG